MKNLHLLRANSWPRLGIYWVSTLWTRSYSAEAPAKSALDLNDSLTLRIRNGRHLSTSMTPILDQWLSEGKDVNQSELRLSIKELRSYRRFRHALQVLEWMSEQRNHNLSPADIAVRVDLISKVHGIEQAEKFFNSIPDDLRNFQVYGSLLNCYAQNKSLEKAEAFMQKMRDLGFVKTYLPYNAMLNLCSELGKYEKMDILIEEMKEKGINCDRFTYNIRLNAYGAASDFEGMEKLLTTMEADPHFKVDWNAYTTVGNWYLKAGLIEKSMAMLKKSERLVKGKVKQFAYEVLLTQYAAAGKKDEVYRIWSLYKKLGKIKNGGYLCAISSLMKLDDVDGAERIFGEWENTHEFFDLRLPNAMICAYCQKGLLEKAVKYLNMLIESGKEPDASTWGHLAIGYRVHGQMVESVEMTKRAIKATRPGWKPNRITLTACLKYLRHQGDVEAAEELLKLLREHGHSPEDIFNKKSLRPQAVDQMEKDGQIAEGETQEIVEFEDKVSS